MRGIVNGVSIARNGQVVLRVDNLDYWTNENYLHALLGSKKLPADIFMLEGCQLEFTKKSHKAGDKVIDGNGKETGQLYKKDGQRMERPSILELGHQAQSFRGQVTKEYAKQTAAQAIGGLFTKSQRSAPADNISVNVEKDKSTNEPTKAEQGDTVAANTVAAGDEDDTI